jgi:hypothetical protein
VQARPLLADGKIDALVDPRLGGDYDGEEARRVAFVAALCIRAPATWRPSMTEVRFGVQVTTQQFLSVSEALCVGWNSALHCCQLGGFSVSVSR